MSVKRKVISLCAIVCASALLWAEIGTVSTASARSTPIIIHTAHPGEHFPGFNKPIFILVLGGDARQGNPDHVRTDSIHIVGIDPVTLHASILGIPRDSYVPIPGFGKDKINSAGYDGGPQLTVQTVEALSGCHFNYYTLTSFTNFTKLVDQFGGITMDVPYSMHERCCSHVDLNPGNQHLTGAQALSFARDRHTFALGDFTRSENQGLIMLGALATAKQDYQRDPGTALRMLAALRRNLVMNIPLLDAIRLGLLMLRIKPANVVNKVVDGTTATVNGASIVQITQKGLNQLADICADGLLSATS